MFVKVYHGFGSHQRVQVTGHVFVKMPPEFSAETNFFVPNIISLFSLFRVKTVPNVVLELNFEGKKHQTKSQEDGFFRFEFDPESKIDFGWYEIEIHVLNDKSEIKSTGKGKILFPKVQKHAIISDIDDTVMKSYSATVFRRLFELFSKNPYHRRIFENTVEWYKELAESDKPGNENKAFFYVSSSEWNLYEYLNKVFKNNDLPKGIFLLNTIKTLKSFFKTGKTGHDGKLLRIGRLLNTFPEQKFVLIGDNTQKDPIIYHEIAMKYPQQIIAVFIRNRAKKNYEKTQKILKELEEKNIRTLQFLDTQEAIDYSVKIGIID